MDRQRHQQRQQRLKDKVDARIAAAREERGIIMIFTGNGKGKSTAAFGTVARAVGHGKRVGVAQFIKGTWENGERNLLEPHGVEFHVMASGFTWKRRIARRISRPRVSSGNRRSECSPTRSTIWWCWMS